MKKYVLTELNVKSSSLKSEKSLPKGKDHFEQKRPCKVPLIKLQKSRVFQFHFDLQTYSGRFQQIAGRKNIFKLNCYPENGIFQESCSPSHSSLEIRACLRIRVKRSTPIVPLCGLGIVKTRSLLLIKGCFPPEYGPSNPSSCNLLTKVRQSTATSLDNRNISRFFDHVISNTGQGESISQPDNNPFINNFFQVSAAFLKGFTGSPDSFKFGNFSIIWFFIIYYFVFCLFKGCLDILDEHDHTCPNIVDLILCGLNLI